jgi:hypothetical protein
VHRAPGSPAHAPAPLADVHQRHQQGGVRTKKKKKKKKKKKRE